MLQKQGCTYITVFNICRQNIQIQRHNPLSSRRNNKMPAAFSKAVVCHCLIAIQILRFYISVTDCLSANHQIFIIIIRRQFSFQIIIAQVTIITNIIIKRDITTCAGGKATCCMSVPATIAQYDLIID